MAPRRPRSTSNANVPAPSNPRAPTSSPLLRKQIAVASDSIYQNNLTVLKRGDPTITSIIDQFSHVCLYNYNGKTKKWAKEGFEGSMFLVEHVDDPIYGLYILNRMGTGDYIRRIYPEDDMEVFGKYLMYRFYPDFTQKRLAMRLPYPIPDQFRPAFDLEFATDNSEPDDPDPSKKPKKQGNSITLGVWGFQQEGHEPLEDVMMRMREYVKRGERYPEQFRYFPGRQGPHPDRLGQPVFRSQNSDEQAPLPTGSQMHFGYQNGGGHGEPSEVDKLFAKLQPTQPPAAVHPATSSRSVESLFAAFTGNDHSLTSGSVNASTSSVASMAPPLASMNPATSTRGMALLGSIFASVSQPGSAASSSHDVHTLSHRLPPRPEEIQIVSPKPQSTALPQILNQNVISSLLGLSPVSANSRSSSAALSSNSNGSRRSGAKRYEGDNELSENDGASEGGHSASSTVLDAETGPITLSRGSPYHLTAVPYPQPPINGTLHTSVSVQGDVTPRAGLRGIGAASPVLPPQRSGQSFLSIPPTSSGDATTTRALSPPGPSHTSSGRPRTLVPFSADSELWPYPRPPVNDNEQASDADVVELDFSDTRALSDPSIFKEKQARQGKGEKKKKTRKERNADRAKERETIENSWDDPTKGQVTLTPASTMSSISSSQAESSLPSPPKIPDVVATANGKPKEAISGRTGNAAAHTTPPHAPANGANGVVKTTANIAREALLASLATHPQTPSRDLSRKQFVQEVLSLIYTSNSFVDDLYEAYCSPARP